MRGRMGGREGGKRGLTPKLLLQGKQKWSVEGVVCVNPTDTVGKQGLDFP